MRFSRTGPCAALALLTITGCAPARHPVRAACEQAARPTSAAPGTGGVLALGSPKGRVGAFDQAGYVVMLYGLASRRLVDQTSPGVPGDPRKNGRFGGAVTSGDFDHDGHPDLAAGTSGTTGPAGPGSVTIVFGAGTGPSGRSVVIPSPPERECPGFGGVLAAADFDGDRFDDLAVACGDGPVEVVYGSPRLVTGTPTRATVNPGPSLITEIPALATGDVTGDGRADLVVESGIDDPADAGYDFTVIPDHRAASRGGSARPPTRRTSATSPSATSTTTATRTSW